MTDPAPAPAAKTPTSEELAAALNALKLVNPAAAAAAQLEVAKAPLRELVAMEGFDEIQKKAIELREGFEAGTPLYQHLAGIAICMQNLKNDVAA